MTKPTPDFERFLGVVMRTGEPDRVPFAELFHDGEIMSAIQGPPPAEPDDVDAHAAWRVAFWRDLGYDYVSQGTDIGFTCPGLSAEDTAALSRGQRGWVNEAKGPIATWAEFEAYPWPEVTPAAFRSLEAVGRALPDGMKATATIPGGPLENLTFLMGFETFSYALVDQPDLVAAVAERVGDILCRVVENTASMDFVGAQWLNDDMGYKNGSLASPEVLRTYVFPAQRRMCEIAHRNRKPVLLHSCGKLDGIMDELIDDIGIDAKHSFEDVIMPVWEAKEKWGKRIGLLGGVDMDVLARGTEDQVRAHTRTCIEKCAPGGGWALGSGNTVANYVPVANFLAMLDEGWRCGRYSGA
ncbi:MAG: uroporphyrinogen-III decarboxylase-like protein [Armatimonadota bacterium]|nr:MAG: uroporphyrinogen-III decarboxylase-like protein [Armatimonadota bacterium]